MAGAPGGLTPRLQGLLDQEARLEEEVQRVQQALSGLRDLDLVLSLAEVKLAACVEMLRHPRQGMAAAVRGKARAALRLVETLQNENVSEDQRGIVQSDPRYEKVRERLQEFLLAGGSGLLEAEPAGARARRILSRTVVSAIRRFAGADDRYAPLDLEEYPPVMRRALRLLFPVFVRENPEQPPYGIEEGQEVTYSSPRMKLPLSQAIFYLEQEVIPGLEQRLAESPGDPVLQDDLRRTRERVEDYRKLRFFPRSTPVLLEKGYYTEGITGYTVDGEMLVPIDLPVSFRSGTNLDRLMEQVRMDVVRRIAGRGVSPEVDREYRRLRSLDSGPRGSSRTASMKLDAAWGYRVLRQDFPFLARLASKEGFLQLVDLVRAAGGAAERRVQGLMESERGGGATLPGT